MMMTRSLVEDVDFFLENNGGVLGRGTVRGVNGHLISVYGIGLPMLLAPFYRVGGIFGSIMLSNIVSALTNVYIFKISKRYLQNNPLALLVTLIFGFASPMLVYSVQLYTEIYMAFIVVFVTYSLLFKKWSPRNLFLSGLCIGYAPLLKYTYTLILVVVSLYVFYTCLKEKVLKEFFYFALPVGGWFFILLLYQYVALGNLVATTNEFAVSWAFPMSMIGGAIGLLVDGEHGLFIYAPVVYLSLFGMHQLLKEKRDVYFVLGIFCSYWILMSAWVDWPGGWCYSARHLIPVLSLLCAPFSFAMREYGKKKWFKAILTLLTIIGLTINVLAVYWRSSWGGFLMWKIGNYLNLKFNLLDILPKLTYRDTLFPARGMFSPSYDWILITFWIFVLPVIIFLRSKHEKLAYMRKNFVFWIFLFFLLICNLTLFISDVLHVFPSEEQNVYLSNVFLEIGLALLLGIFLFYLKSRRIIGRVINLGGM